MKASQTIILFTTVCYDSILWQYLTPVPLHIIYNKVSQMYPTTESHHDSTIYLRIVIKKTVAYDLLWLRPVHNSTSQQS